MDKRKNTEAVIRHRMFDRRRYKHIGYSIVWGSTLHRSCFLVGREAHGARYLLRCYPRPDFWGFPIRASSWAKPDSFWFVGFQESKDGAMELLMAIPLPGEPSKNLSQTKAGLYVPKEDGEKISLDSIIQRAREKGQ